jgi:glutamine amidotransferase
MISVLDYGAGNVGSVIRMIKRSGGVAQRISSSEEALIAKKLLILGVGAFDCGMGMLATRKLL